MHGGLRHLPSDISDGEDEPGEKTPIGLRRPRNETMIAVKPYPDGKPRLICPSWLIASRMPASPAMPPLIISVDQTVREASKPP